MSPEHSHSELKAMPRVSVACDDSYNNEGESRLELHIRAFANNTT